MRHISCIGIVVALLLAAPVPVAAAELGNAIMNMSPGDSSCGHWTNERGVAGRGLSISVTQEGMPLVEMEGWVRGYITAMNYWVIPRDRDGIRNLTEGTDTEGIMAWIDNYCAAHPLDLLDDATMALTAESRTKWLIAHPKPPASIRK